MSARGTPTTPSQFLFCSPVFCFAGPLLSLGVVVWVLSSPLGSTVFLVSVLALGVGSGYCAGVMKCGCGKGDLRVQTARMTREGYTRWRLCDGCGGRWVSLEVDRGEWRVMGVEADRLRGQLRAVGDLAVVRGGWVNG